MSIVFVYEHNCNLEAPTLLDFYTLLRLAGRECPDF